MQPERVAKKPYRGCPLVSQSDTLGKESPCDAFFRHSPKVGLVRDS
jgi:hypothetical protein